MITIQEISPPHKLSGLSSLVVQFDYNPYIVDALKTLPTYNYDKRTKLWEVPLCYLGRLLDNLTFLDDIQLKLLDTPENGGITFHSSVLAWRIPWMEKPGRLQSMGSHRVGYD